MADPSPKTASRRYVTAMTALWALGTGSAAGLAGCYGHNCDGYAKPYGSGPGEGRLLDVDTWESSPVDGVWLDFPQQRSWNFDLRALGDRAPQLILPYVSAQADPLHEPGGNFTVGAGNIVEISGADKGRITIHNGTCADYYLRLVVVAAAAPSGAAATDAGASDAASDAGAEAGP